MLVIGRFSPHPRGFGFIDLAAPVELTLPDGTTSTVDSLFVPPPVAKGWLAGDEVKAEVLAEADGRASATSLTLVARSRRFVVGEVTTFGATAVLKLDPRVGVGQLPLGDALAAQVTLGQGRQIVAMLGAAEDGSTICGALVAGPDPMTSPKAIRARAVTIAFGSASPEGIPGGPEAVRLPEAQTIGMSLRATGQLASGREGLAAGLAADVGPVPAAMRELTNRLAEVCITIDDDRTRDLDDAVSATWDGTADQPVVLTVHIADASGAVGIDSPADQYAATMGTTAYFVNGPTAPMLDPVLSEGELSLLPETDRRVITVRLEIAPDGNAVATDIDLSWIRTTARLSYVAVDLFLADGDVNHLAAGTHGPTGAKLTDLTAVSATVRAMDEAARRLGVERDARDTLEGLFEPTLLEATTIDGRIRTMPADPHPDAQRLIERAMVATNEAVATWAAEHKVPILYRSHAGFDPERLPRLIAAAAEAGVEFPATEGPLGPREVLHVIGELQQAGRDEAAAMLATAATGVVARATYSASPDDHVAMGSGFYTHFTSPIRRYADLVVHRQIRATLGGETPPYDVAHLTALAPWLDVRAGAADFAQALERNALWAILLDRGAINWPAVAVVTGVTTAGLRVRLTEPGVTGFVPAAHVLGIPFKERPALEVDEHGLATTDGAWRLGRRIEVRLDRIDDTGRPELKLA